MVIWLSISVVAISHGLYLGPLLRCARRHIFPLPIDFVGLSALAFFDLGLLLEGCGLRFQGKFFLPFFEASQGTLILAVILMVSAPWLMKAGAGWRQVPPRSKCGLVLRRGRSRAAFYLVLSLTCVACAALPFFLLALSPRLWETRALLGEQMGPWIILLSLPMHLLAFYIRLSDSDSRLGRVVIAALVIAACLSTVAVGERTHLILPILTVLLFGKPFSLPRWSAGIGMGALCAALMLPLFKPSYTAEGDFIQQTLSDTVMNDLYRAPELAEALRRSHYVGAGTAYLGAGYVYAVFLFVPRSLAPFKGEASAQQFTAQVMQQDPKSLTWGFGISAISEAILNVGIVLAPLLLVCYGWLIGWLTRASEKRKSLEIPLCLASLWIFGYHVSALLLNFGVMALVGLLCERLFTDPLSVKESA